MELTPLTAISPVDGRYHSRLQPLAAYFSEFAFFRYRILVEVEYFIALCELPLPQLRKVDHAHFAGLRAVYKDLTIKEAGKIKEIEKETNHDVKAVEYYLKKRLDAINLGPYKEFVHFGLTSQDVNNTAIPMSLRDALKAVYHPLLKEVLNKLGTLAEEWADVPLLARTHGQPASPTRMGKEIQVFAERIKDQRKLLMDVPFRAKFGGATGNLNAHKVAYPEVDWLGFADRFVRDRLDMERTRVTTQIEHYDNLAALFDNLKRINTILLDFCQDIWSYISRDYFKQKLKAGEVGSSAMPHKVNPIDFENAEGNLGIANGIFEHLSRKLPVSRLQRDLSDSTVMRNIGVPVAHTVLAMKSLLAGLHKIELNEAVLQADLEANWVVVAEAIQTILRREGVEAPYEMLKKITRTGGKVDQAAIEAFVEALEVEDKVKKELREITPFNYTGFKP